MIEAQVCYAHVAKEERNKQNQKSEGGDKGAIFPKYNIAEDTKTMRDRIITPIPLLSFTIAKKTTKP